MCEDVSVCIMSCMSIDRLELSSSPVTNTEKSLGMRDIQSRKKEKNGQKEI